MMVPVDGDLVKVVARVDEVQRKSAGQLVQELLRPAAQCVEPCEGGGGDER